MAHYKKIKLLLNYVLGPVLFVLIGLSIYRQVTTQPHLQQHMQMVKTSFQQKGWWMLLIIGLLMLLNWGLEAWKWQRLVNHLMPISWFKALLGVLAGVSFTMLTPNRMGEFMGRLLYMPDGSRIKAATLSTLSSMSQLMITMAAGIGGVWYLQQYYGLQWPALLSQVLLYGTTTVFICMLLVYFNLGAMVRLLEKWPVISKYAPLIHAVGEIRSKELLAILTISAIRYAVFIVQYGLVFFALDISMPWMGMAAGTATMFLILAIVPSISLAELGIRGSTSLYVFGIFSTNSFGILVAAAIVWLINIIFPALVGSLIFLGIKLFGKTSFEKA